MTQERWNLIWRCWEKYRKALKINKLVKEEKCWVCLTNKKIIIGHHPNHNKPFMILWLCNSCHMKLHAQIKRNKSYFKNTRDKKYTELDFNNNKSALLRFKHIVDLHYQLSKNHLEGVDKSKYSEIIKRNMEIAI